MLKMLAIVGLLALGPAVPASAHEAPSQQSAAAVAPGCLGEPGSWLPGTLQIDEPAVPAKANPTAPSPGDGAVAHDCALA